MRALALEGAPAPRVEPARVRSDFWDVAGLPARRAYWVASTTRGYWYLTSAEPEHCTCAAFVHGHEQCRHVRAVRDYLAREARS